ncbi:MAG: hypothetical protein WBH10_05450, partial [Allopontixanthobacter sediminis]
MFADHNLPFSVALLLLALLAIVQLIGVGDFSTDGGLDGDIDSDTAEGLGTAGFADSLASIIGLGRVPFTIWLGALLFLFAGLGFSIQMLAEG